ncbi:MAG: hypothetical protein RJA98_1967, partial [Pseudomonadota bacterium]
WSDLRSAHSPLTSAHRPGPSPPLHAQRHAWRWPAITGSVERCAAFALRRSRGSRPQAGGGHGAKRMRHSAPGTGLGMGFASVSGTNLPGHAERARLNASPDERLRAGLGGRCVGGTARANTGLALQGGRHTRQQLGREHRAAAPTRCVKTAAAGRRAGVGPTAQRADRGRPRRGGNGGRSVSAHGRTVEPCGITPQPATPGRGRQPLQWRATKTTRCPTGRRHPR